MVLIWIQPEARRGGTQRSENWDQTGQFLPLNPRVHEVTQARLILTLTEFQVRLSESFPETVDFFFSKKSFLWAYPTATFLQRQCWSQLYS